MSTETETPTIDLPTPLPVGWKWTIGLIEAAGDTVVICTCCGYPGAVRTRDERGALIAHPGRGWPCRVPSLSVAT